MPDNTSSNLKPGAGYVNTDGLNIHDSPGGLTVKAYGKYFNLTILPDAPVTAVSGGKSYLWYHIKLADGFTGWAAANFLAAGIANFLPGPTVIGYDNAPLHDLPASANTLRTLPLNTSLTIEANPSVRQTGRDNKIYDWVKVKTADGLEGWIATAFLTPSQAQTAAPVLVTPAPVAPAPSVPVPPAPQPVSAAPAPVQPIPAPVTPAPSVPVPPPTPVNLNPGAAYINVAGLNVHDSPTGPTVRTYSKYFSLTILPDAAVSAGSYFWYHVQFADGFTGWAAGLFLAAGTVNFFPGSTSVSLANALLRDAPANGNTLRTLPINTSLTIEGDPPMQKAGLDNHLYNWVKVKTQDGVEGWIPTAFLTPNQPQAVAPAPAAPAPSVPVPPAPVAPAPVQPPSAPVAPAPVTPVSGSQPKTLIGPHMMGPLTAAELSTVCGLGASVYKVLLAAGTEIDYLIQAHNANPNAICIVRKYKSDGDQYQLLQQAAGNLDQAVNSWMAELAPFFQKAPWAYFEGLNEIDAGNNVYLAFEAARTRRMAAQGLRACVLNVAVGHTDSAFWARAKDMVQATIDNQGIIGVHAYSQTVMSESYHGNGWRADGSWQGEVFPQIVTTDGAYTALRILVDVQNLTAQGQGRARLVVTELGLDDLGGSVHYPATGHTRDWQSCIPAWQANGWLNGTTPEAFYKRQLDWWGSIVGQLPQIIGGTVFTYGHIPNASPDWKGYDVRTVLV